MGLALVFALAALVAVVAAGGSGSVTPAVEALPSSSGGPCQDPSGICRPPDECPAARHVYSIDELERIRPDVESMLGNTFYDIGTGEHAIEMDLFPGHEALASALDQRFGDALTIRIGTTRYCQGPGRSARCADLAGATALPRGLHLELALDQHGLRRTEAAGNATLHVRFDGPGRFTLDGGRPIIAKLVKPGTRTVIGTFTGGTRGTGYGLSLAAGRGADIDVIVGISRCDGGLGSALPPGTYGVRAWLGPDGGPPQYLAPEVPLTIL